jgi:8-oxo-dGTP pyrophosphatase MutT (NUDIX family)
MEKEVYKGKIIKVTEETIDKTVWERVYLPDGVIVFPITDEGKVLMITEKRPHETPNIRLKAVSGILEHDKGTPEENAQREMQEEIGFKASKMIPLMTLKGSGTVNSTQHFFIARGLIHSKLPNPDGEDTILDITPFTPLELIDALMADRIKWSTSALGIFRLVHALRETL